MLENLEKNIYFSENSIKKFSFLEFLENKLKIKDRDILETIIYKSFDDIKKSQIPRDSLAYINFLANNILRDAYKWKIDNTKPISKSFIALKSIFNILNGNNESAKYEAKYLSHKYGINYPSKNEINYSPNYYSEIKNKLQDLFKDFKLDKDYITFLTGNFEDYFSYLPYLDDKKESSDISLFDHIKMTITFASCIYDYLISKGKNDFSVLVEEKDKYYEEEMFYLYSFDFSGIQSFIYNISSDKALRSLRTRSFYLELLLEDIIDTLLDRLDLHRSNLLYSGGGHCYLILPNTEFVKKEVEKFKDEVNAWLLNLFASDLYLAGGGDSCSANTFCANYRDEYSELFRTVSNKISKNKLNRYNQFDLKKLNFEEIIDGERECKVCRRVDHLVESEKGLICSICNEIENFSKSILEDKIFVVENKSKNKIGYSLPLPFDKILTSVKDEAEFKNKFKNNNFVRAYSKNNEFSEEKILTRLWIGDYSYDNKLNIFTENAKGIKRLGVIRADVDNLGQSFVRGFSTKDASLTRSAVFSRSMSLFFKYHINYLLENGEFSLTGENLPIKRKALIVYSGGDDIFVVGAWDDIIGFSIDLVKSLKKFTLNSLTISAGIGLFAEKFPIKSIAEITGNLEDYAKANRYEVYGEEKTKNSVCLFNKENIYSWNDFEEKVLGKKLKLLKDYFIEIDERGKSFLYRVLNLLREVNSDKLNIARLAYLLSRLEPQNKNLMEKHSEFSKRVYRYARNEKDRKELITAIYIFVYLERR